MESSAQQVGLAQKQCQDIQHMIDITSDHLERLRSTFNNAGDELTKQEIRTLEGKLIKQFSEQLAVKTRLGGSGQDLLHFPKLPQWLKVVGVSAETSEAIRGRVRSLEELKDKTECELQRVLLAAGQLTPVLRREDLRRLNRALLNLRKYTDALVYGAKQYGPSQDPAKLELHWDSWNHTALVGPPECSSPKTADYSLPPRVPQHDGESPRAVPLPLRRDPRGGDSAASSLSSSSSVPPPSPSSISTSTLSPPTCGPESRGPMITPPATPPWAFLSSRPPPLPQSQTKHGLATPPAIKKHSTGIRHDPSLSKSKSHECELSSGREDGESGVPNDRVDSSGYSSSSEAPPGRKRLHSSEPETGEAAGASPAASPLSPPAPPGDRLKVPRSPHTPGQGNTPSLNRPMAHMITHRFTKTFKPARCDLCQEFFYLQGLKCKECKFRCHTQCESQVPPSCGLPAELLEIYWEHMKGREGSPSLQRSNHPDPAKAFESSSSSCNSSTPSSPQVIVTSNTPPWTSRPGHPSSSRPHFTFPDPVTPASRPLPPVSLERVVSPNPAVESVKSNDSDKTLSGSSDSIGTAYRMDSQVRAPPWAPLTPAPGLDHLGGGGRPQHLELWPPDVHQGVGHSLRGTQVGGQDWLRSVLHGACRQLARRCGHQVPGYGEP